VAGELGDEPDRPTAKHAAPSLTSRVAGRLVATSDAIRAPDGICLARRNPLVARGRGAATRN
jgi:hypothetical protein